MVGKKSINVVMVNCRMCGVPFLKWKVSKKRQSRGSSARPSIAVYCKSCSKINCSRLLNKKIKITNELISATQKVC